MVGAHLTGMPLNGELKSFGARFLERTTTTADYRLFLLPGTAPAKPGLLRVGTAAGVAVDVEIWTMPAEQFGRFVASIPAPLSIGTLTITDGRDVKGFLVEAEATRDARDISAFGGWRNFMEQMKVERVSRARLRPYCVVTAGYPATPPGKPMVTPGISTAPASQFLLASSRTIQNATVLDSISRASRSECFMRIMN